MILRIACVLVCAVLLAGCADTEEERAGSSPTPATDARAGGHLTVAIIEPTSVDPALVPPYDEAGSLVVQTMCDPLIALDPESGDPVPALAEEWEVGGSGTSVTVSLRKGITFSNGEPLDSGDVVRSLARVADPALGSPNEALLEIVDGYEDFRRGEAEEDRLPGIGVTDPYGVEIALEEPRSLFYRFLTTSPAMPLPENLIGDAGPATELSRQPVCAGPYRMTQPWELGDSSITLERVEDYHGQNTAFTRGGQGWVDRITFRIYPDREGAFAAFEREAVDVAPVPNEMVERARAMEGVTVEQTAAPILEYIGFPSAIPPFDLRAVRIAISRALDREAIVERVYGGSRIPARGIVPPTIGDDLYRPDACGENAPAVADVGSARAELEGAGIDPEDLSVPIYYNDDFDNQALVNEVALQLRKTLGITVTPEKLGFTAHINKGRSAEGFDGLFRLSWGMAYPSPDEFLAPLFATSGIGVENLTRFSNPEFDEILNEEAREAIALDLQQAAYWFLESTVCQEMPIVPIAFGAREFAFRTDAVDSAVGTFLHRSFAQPLLRELYAVP